MELLSSLPLCSMSIRFHSTRKVNPREVLSRDDKAWIIRRSLEEHGAIVCQLVSATPLNQRITNSCFYLTQEPRLLRVTHYLSILRRMCK